MYKNIIKKYLIICLCILISLFSVGCEESEVKSEDNMHGISDVHTVSNVFTAKLENEEIKVYITETGTKYHRIGCGSLWNSCMEISLESAKNRGYSPCMKCEPEY